MFSIRSLFYLRLYIFVTLFFGIEYCKQFVHSSNEVREQFASISLLSSTSFPVSQFQALYDLYNATNGLHWIWTSSGSHWNFTNPHNNPCIQKWQGVKCVSSAAYGYGVSYLGLSGYNLTGTIPESFGDLVNLTQVFMTENFLSGPLPESLYTLHKLFNFDIAENAFNGTVSNNLGSLTALKLFIINENNFTSTIPSSVSNLHSLQQFDVSYNNMIGTIPEAVYSLTTLTKLVVENNHFFGTIPKNLQKLSKLQSFVLNNNHFFGNLSNQLFPTSLNTLSISNNLFTGTIPTSLGGTFSKLTTLDFSYNSFHGTLSSSFVTTVVRIIDFAISTNFLTGDIGSLFSPNILLSGFNLGDNLLSGNLPVLNATYLTYYIVRANYLSGSISDFLFNNSYLVDFDVSDNWLTGKIHFGEHVFPQYLNISTNFFTGNMYSFFNFQNYTQTMTEMSLVQELNLENNQFTGSLPNWWKFPNLYALTVGNNQLTGTLPAFNTSFYGASTNCFHGRIPQELCNMSLLQVVAMNGLSSSSNCQIPLFPGTSIETFSTRYTIDNGIPSCLFNLPSLTILQLSGNGLTGSLPENVTISPSLVNLDLSHNSLSGSIPLTIQEKKWFNLDLSYNFFSGELSDAVFPSYSNLETLTLIVNRLSGDIPSALLAAENINILEGNIFTCNYDSNLVPSHDPHADSYSCGSDLVNLSIYFWLSAGTVLLLTTLSVYYHLIVPSCMKSLSILCNWYDHFHFYCLKERQEPKTKGNPILLLWTFNQRIRFTAGVLTIFILIILLPSYGVLSMEYSTYENKYAWTISGLYLSGAESAITLSIELFVFIVFTTVFVLFLWVMRVTSLWPFTVQYDETISNSRKEEEEETTIEEKKEDNSNNHNNTRVDSVQKEQQPKRKKRNLFDLPLQATVAFINFVVMMSSDVAFVVIVINYNTTIIILAEIALALLKIFWNNFFIWNMMKKLSKWIFLGLNRLRQEEFTGKVRDFDHIRDCDIPFIALNIGLNNLIYPVIAIMVVSSNCFYNAIFSAAPITTSYTAPVSGYSTTASEVTIESSYDPPFSYSYQCSSVIYAYYCPVFIFMLAFEAVFIPVLLLSYRIMISKNNNNNNKSSKSNEEDGSDNRKISRVELVSRSSLPVSESGGGKSFPLSEQQQNSETTTVSSSSAPRLTFFQRVVNYIDESSLLKENHNTNNSSSSSKRILFDKNRYVIRMISYLLILVAYGAIFPPLAIIVFLSVILRTVYEEILMGRLLFTFPQRTERRLLNDCQGMMTPMKYCLAIIIPISTLLYSYLIFDSFGKEEEEGIAIIPGIIFGVYSIVLVVWLNTMNTRTKKRKDETKMHTNNEGKDENETNITKSNMNDDSSVENPMY
jgi:Leucine-rich repeat (LRR) protein